MGKSFGLPTALFGDSSRTKYSSSWAFRTPLPRSARCAGCHRSPSNIGSSRSGRQNSGIPARSLMSPNSKEAPHPFGAHQPYLQARHAGER